MWKNEIIIYHNSHYIIFISTKKKKQKKTIFVNEKKAQLLLFNKFAFFLWGWGDEIRKTSKQWVIRKLSLKIQQRIIIEN